MFPKGIDNIGIVITNHLSELFCVLIIGKFIKINETKKLLCFKDDTICISILFREWIKEKREMCNCV